MLIHTYLPQDRLRTLQSGKSLPDRTTGSALFADISGFTALAESLRNSFGSRRGSEELTKQLDAVYNALISEVERFGGSVIAFAGDAITCWFDDSDASASPRSVACGFALQETMETFASVSLPNGAIASLKLKVSISSGPARRFIVGDPMIHCMDALAGATIARTSTGEHNAEKGDVILDEATVNALGGGVIVREWRIDPDTGERFAVADQFSGLRPEIPAPDFEFVIDPSEVKPYIHRSVYQREVEDQQVFLTEFRPCVAVFIRFIGIDFDSNEAEHQLDTFIRKAQAVTLRHGGTLLEITIGDKGSYAYINFGALRTYEDDARRAVLAALDIHKATHELGFPLSLQTGITQGVMRVGAYGGQTRRTYGALGDDVNLAARLMQKAQADEILVSKHVQEETEKYFNFEPRPPLTLKGKSKPMTAYKVIGEQRQRSMRLQEPNYALPMVGRATELAIIQERLSLAAQGKAQVIGIVAEAGMGKSRLVAEVIRSARQMGFTGYGGACQSDGVTTPYLVWRSIWNALLNVDPDLALEDQIHLLGEEILKRSPDRLQALPLLEPVLNISIPENDFTKSLEPKNRRGALHALLEDCLKAELSTRPLLIVIEDLHWIDALAYDLLEELARTLSDCAICFVLAFRPPQLARLIDLPIANLPHFAKIELAELNDEECKQAISAKLAQLYPDAGSKVPRKLVEKLAVKAQGNPFYLEELLNYLHDRGIDVKDSAALDQLELPDSLHTLILSRIDQLTEREKSTLRVASIIGRLFRAAWLTGYYPKLGDLTSVKHDLEKLNGLDITPMDAPEPELVYLFKHIVTHEVAYETLPFSMRAHLHEQLARYLEATYPDSPPLNELAFHYSQSENKTKQREYLRKAGESAQEAFANDAALGYYQKLIDLLTDDPEQINILLKRGSILEITGEWNGAELDYKRAWEIATLHNDLASIAQCDHRLGILCNLRGDSNAALEWLKKSREIFQSLNDRTRLGQVIHSTGLVHLQKGDYDPALDQMKEALVLARGAGNKRLIADILNAMGMTVVERGDYVNAQNFFEESLSLSRFINNKEGIGMTTNNLGLVALQQDDLDAAWRQFDESLRLARAMGNKRGIAIGLSNLGYVAANQGNFPAAHALYEEALSMYLKMGNKGGIATARENLGFVDIERGDLSAAQDHFRESLRLANEIGSKFHIIYSLVGLGNAGILSQLSAMPNLAIMQKSVQLNSAADAQLKALNMTLERLEQKQFQRLMDEARLRMGGEAFAQQCAEGRIMTLEKSVALVLG